MTETTTKIRTRPAAVILTPAAERRIADLMAQAPEGAIGVKLSTPRRGCSGLAYSVAYVSDEAKFDEKIETREEERRVGKECVSTGTYRWTQETDNNKNKQPSRKNIINNKR